MKENRILVKVYTASSIIIVPIVLLTCFLCEWPLLMIIVALFASIIIVSPVLFSLQIVVLLFKRVQFRRSFMWMLLLSLIPLLSLLVAWMFADFVPGKIWFVLLVGMLGSYTGILKNGISVTQLFKPI